MILHFICDVFAIEWGEVNASKHLHGMLRNIFFPSHELNGCSCKRFADSSHSEVWNILKLEKKVLTKSLRSLPVWRRYRCPCWPSYLRLGTASHFQLIIEITCKDIKFTVEAKLRGFSCRTQLQLLNPIAQSYWDVSVQKAQQKYRCHSCEMTSNCNTVHTQTLCGNLRHSLCVNKYVQCVAILLQIHAYQKTWTMNSFWSNCFSL